MFPTLVLEWDFRFQTLFNVKEDGWVSTFYFPIDALFSYLQNLIDFHLPFYGIDLHLVIHQIKSSKFYNIFCALTDISHKANLLN